MLTGNISYRLGWRKKLILQVEEWRLAIRFPKDRRYVKRWRDASVEDVEALDAGRFSEKYPGHDGKENGID